MKKKILNLLKQKIQDQLDAAKESYTSSLGHARSEDMKSEGKYDTRAIEAGYLTSAQKQRVEDLEKELELIESVQIVESEKAALGSLLLLEVNKVRQWHFLSATSGGAMLNIDGKPILVISVFSPIGAEVLGLGAGDSFEIETPKETREYSVIEIL